MKNENLEKLKKSVKAQSQEDYTAYYDKYEEKFGYCPMIRITMPYGLDNPDFKKCVKKQ